MLSFLEYTFSSKSVIFIGFGLRNLNTNSILFWKNKTLKNNTRKSYSITNSINEYFKKVSDKRGVIVIEEDAIDFLKNLATQLDIDTSMVVNELDFNADFQPYTINKGQKSKIIFRLKNNLSENIRCISYRFETYFRNDLLVSFRKHVFNLEIAPGKEEIKEFGLVDPMSYYFGNKMENGEYLAKIFLEYQVCSECIDTEHIVKNQFCNASLIVE